MAFGWKSGLFALICFAAGWGASHWMGDVPFQAALTTMPALQAEGSEAQDGRQASHRTTAYTRISSFDPERRSENVMSADLPKVAKRLDVLSVPATELIDRNVASMHWIASAETAELLTWIRESQREENPDYFMMSVAASRLADLDAAAALQLVRENEEPDFGVTHIIFARPGKSDLPASLIAFESLPESKRQIATMGILETAPVDDPVAWVALQEALAQHNNSEYDNSLGIWSMRSVKNNPEAILHALTAQPVEEGPGVGRLQAFVSVWLMSDFDNAVPALTTLPDEQRDLLLNKFESGGLPASDVEKAVSWLVDSGTGPFEKLLPVTLRNYASQNPEKAMDTALSLKGELRSRSIEEVIYGWGFSSPSEAGDWVIGNDDLVEAPRLVERIALIAAQKDRGKAIEWADSIESPELRQIAQKTITHAGSSTH